jgi:hypothetical protein
VASHAQKYFNRPKIPCNKRRASIHDIRLPNKSAVENTNIATPVSNYGLFTNIKRATPENNYSQFANSVNTTPNSNYWQFASSNNTTPNSKCGYFANNLAHGSVVGPSGSNPNICTEPTVPFAGHQQFFNPYFQFSSMFNFEDGI